MLCKSQQYFLQFYMRCFTKSMLARFSDICTILIDGLNNIFTQMPATYPSCVQPQRFNIINILQRQFDVGRNATSHHSRRLIYGRKNPTFSRTLAVILAQPSDAFIIKSQVTNEFSHKRHQLNEKLAIQNCQTFHWYLC